MLCTSPMQVQICNMACLLPALAKGGSHSWKRLDSTNGGMRCPAWIMQEALGCCATGGVVRVLNVKTPLDQRKALDRDPNSMKGMNLFLNTRVYELICLWWQGPHKNTGAASAKWLYRTVCGCSNQHALAFSSPRRTSKEFLIWWVVWHFEELRVWLKHTKQSKSIRPYRGQFTNLTVHMWRSALEDESGDLQCVGDQFDLDLQTWNLFCLEDLTTNMIPKYYQNYTGDSMDISTLQREVVYHAGMSRRVPLWVAGFVADKSAESSRAFKPLMFQIYFLMDLGRAKTSKLLWSVCRTLRCGMFPCNMIQEMHGIDWRIQDQIPDFCNVCCSCCTFEPVLQGV